PVVAAERSAEPTRKFGVERGQSRSDLRNRVPFLLVSFLWASKEKKLASGETLLENDFANKGLASANLLLARLRNLGHQPRPRSPLAIRRHPHRSRLKHHRRTAGPVLPAASGFTAAPRRLPDHRHHAATGARKGHSRKSIHRQYPPRTIGAGHLQRRLQQHSLRR